MRKYVTSKRVEAQRAIRLLEESGGAETASDVTAGGEKARASSTMGFRWKESPGLVLGTTVIRQNWMKRHPTMRRLRMKPNGSPEKEGEQLRHQQATGWSTSMPANS